MSLDHLEHVARLAGFAAVPDEEDTVAEEARERLATLRERLRTPDAPAPRRAATLAAPLTATVTTYVNGAIRSAQGLIGTRGATA